jgi:hypothetical protein
MTIQEIKQAISALKAAHSLVGLTGPPGGGMPFQQNSLYKFIKPMLINFDLFLDAYDKGIITEEVAIQHLTEGLQIISEAFNSASAQ